ncbi:MAG: DNA polymerase III subunit alpha [Thermodesulfobacteriota bacterium]
MDDFVHLDVRSGYSFLWGAFTPEELVRAASGLGQRAVALTDDGLHGVVRFCRAAAAAGVQPIVGAGVRMADGSRLVLLVRSGQGYAHLCRLLSVSYSGGLLPEPKVTLADLVRWAKGLVCLEGGWGSGLRERLSAGRFKEAKLGLLRLRQAFPGPESLFVALENHGLEEDGRVAGSAARLAEELGLPLVAANATAFLTPEDFEVHRTLVDIQRNHHHRRVDPLPNDSFSLVPGSEMARRVPFPEALANTGRIAGLCRGFALPLGGQHPPMFQPSRAAARRLAALSLTELARRFPSAPAAYLSRLERELEVLERRGLADYFLLVREVSAYARRRGIRHSVRGSAAGSLVVHLTLGGVDPVAQDLLFERFLNDGRRDLPDVDLDFDSERRDEVVRYLFERFPGQAALVATVSTLGLRGAVRLAARALGRPPGELRGLTRCLPWSVKKMDLAGALAGLPELRTAPLKQDPELVRVASRLARLPFQTSVHLGGVLIAPGRVTDWTPTALSPKGFPVAHLDKDDLEALGLLKLDLLGLRTHTALRKAADLLSAQGRPLDLDNLPPDDPATYAMLRQADSLGVFQIESPGQRQLLGRLQPRRFPDLIAQISLFRPGPVSGNLVDPFVRRRLGLEPARPPHPSLAQILKETHGLIIFQEQVLKIVHAFAGLSYSQADVFRRTMTKDRGAKQMEELRRRFVEGAERRGHGRTRALEVFDHILALAAYGFCKAHAASFAHLTYQSAYLKAHSPQAFYVGLLSAGQVGAYPASVLLNEARRRGLPVFAPHVNTAGPGYEPREGGIQAPLTVIKGLGVGLARRIRAERDRGGLFRSREDFLSRVPLPARTVAVLDLAGALEGLEARRGELFPEALYA